MSVKFRFESVRGGGEPATLALVQGTLLLKEVDKVSLGAKGSILLFSKDPAEATMTSDGGRMVTRNGTAPLLDRATPKALKAACAILLARQGAFPGAFQWKPADEDEDLARFKAGLKISEFKFGEDEKGAKSLTYTLTTAAPQATYDAKLWYDPGTLKLLKRTFQHASTPDSPRVTETYEEFARNGDVPDEKFKVPAGAAPQEEKVAAARAMLAQLSVALAHYEVDNGVYPTPEQGLEALLRKPETGPLPKKWKGPYLEGKTVPKDPWERAYVYKFPGEKNPNGFDLLSTGPDGKMGTGDDVIR